MSNIRITSLNGQLNGTSSTFGNTQKDGNGTITQTTYLPKTNDTLQVYKYVCSATSTTETLTGNTATITLPSAGVGLSTGRFGQLSVKVTVVMLTDASGELIPKIFNQYLLQTAVEGTGDLIQPPYIAKLLSSDIENYIPTNYSTTTVTPSSPGISLTNASGIFTLTVASSTLTAPGSTFNILAEFDFISSVI